MAEKKVYVGSVGPFLFDDTDPIDDPDGDWAGVNRNAFTTNSQIIVDESPSLAHHVIRKADLETLFWPVGSLYFSASSTNPNTILGFGSWSRIAEGQFLVGQKAGDADFGTAGTSGGSKTHTHSVPAHNTGYSDASLEEVDNNLDGDTVEVTPDHRHTAGGVTSGNNSALPPYYVLYIWRRTA